MRRTSILSVLVVLVLGTAARASDPIGIYALVDRVVMEPSEGMPERVQIYGVFTMADRQTRSYTEPVRGYMYFGLPGDQQEQARTEWADLKRVAGSGEIVGFGNRYKSSGRIRTGVGPQGVGEAADGREIELLIAKLSEADQAVRDRATEELQGMGRQIEPATHRALSQKPSAEVRARLERLLEQFKPDEYPVGWGLTRMRQNSEWAPVKRLRLTPAVVSPAQESYVEGGRVTLVAQNIAMKDAVVQYVFEIENAQGERETSEPISSGIKQTEWTPKMQLKPGARYAWRVYVKLAAELRKAMAAGGDGKEPWPTDRGPVVEVTFRAK
jgi:hypothetical protein